jgi:HK97 family phage prohead protease
MKSKSFKYQVKDVNEKGIVTIAISKFDNIDSYGDIVRKGAFAKTFKEGSNRIKHVLDHELRYQSLVGLPAKMYETDTHAVVESVLNLELQKAKDLFSNYKFFAANDRTLEHSYMYETIKRNENNDIKGEEIAELKMYEYSTVAMGANPETPLIDLKSLKSADDVLNSIEQLAQHLRKGDITNEQGEKLESLINTLKTYIEPLNSTQIDYKLIFKNVLKS